MTTQRTIRTITLLGLLFACGIRGQKTAPLPKQFELLYEEGLGDTRTGTVHAESYDGFDSEKKVRSVDTEGGQTKYKAELTDGERNTIFQAVAENDILSIKTDFTNLCGREFQPSLVGRLRLKIEGKVTEIRFNSNYGRSAGQASARCPFGAVEDWTRFRKVLDVLQDILKSRDDKQKLRPHKGYL